MNTVARVVARNARARPTGLAFDRETQARGAEGCVLVVDSRDEASFPEVRRMASWLDDRRIPLVVAANKQDRPDALAGPILRPLLGLAQDIKVLECSALKRESVCRVLDELEGDICD